MDDLSRRAALWGVETEYYDALGRLRVVEPGVLTRLLDIVATAAAPARRMLPQIVVVRPGEVRTLTVDVPPGSRLHWEILADAADAAIAGGEAFSGEVQLPGDLPVGSFHLKITATSAGETRSEEAALLSAPRQAHQGDDTQRSWALAVQLYGLRSHRNWGHGDFTDLGRLIDLAAAVGAAGIGLNPLHALFDDRGEEASPYFPSSRLFLNPLYVDVEAIPEFPGVEKSNLGPELEALRACEFVDYGGAARLKMGALAAAYESFRRRASPKRRRDFADFRKERGPLLSRFAAFETLRRRFSGPWWEWPAEWQHPDAQSLERLRASNKVAFGFAEFLQWTADRQLAACRDQAKQRGMTVGLYLDIAVGVRSDGFDAWNDPSFFHRSLEIGAPPDALNTAGQRWGLAGVNPDAFIARACEPLRQLLRASMRYSGAVRLDHVLGLNRLYLIPKDMRADQGTYVRFPFEAQLAVIAQESVANRCLVIGEDLGTVPKGFREKLADWGIWSYQVMMFERAEDGGFIAPEHYRRNALVTFSTHDLPTFAGWASRHDLAVKRGIGLDPGETDAERAQAQAALGRALAARGMPAVDFLSATRFLAQTPCRLLVVQIEDVLGIADQANVPGTINEHPNWRRRLPVALEDLKGVDTFSSVAAIMAETGRSLTS
jgi:4-alpha-glucanotransferase